MSPAISATFWGLVAGGALVVDAANSMAVACGLASLAGYTLFGAFSPFIVACTTAVAAGGMLTMIVDAMIPEAVAETHDWAGLIAVIGFLVFFALSKVAG